MSAPERDLRDKYGDLLAGDDPAMQRLIRDLDAGYGRPRLPARFSVLPRDAGRTGKEVSAPLGGTSGFGRRRTFPFRRLSGRRQARWMLHPAVLIAALIAVSAVVAAGSRINLGKPTNDVPAYVPLGSFRHASGLTLIGHGKPELLWVGTQVDPLSGVERWAMIKALEQFGTLSGVVPARTPACQFETFEDPCSWPLPTFDWSHARYQSRYIVFVHRDLIDGAGKPAQPLTALERRLFDRYVGLPASSFQAAVQAVLANTNRLPPIGRGIDSRQFPLVAVSGYVQTGDGVAIPGDFLVPNPHPGPLENAQNYLPLSFSTVQQALIHGKVAGSGPRSLVPDINIETNILTALICHVDRLQPASVCNRPAIRQLLHRGT